MTRQQLFAGGLGVAALAAVVASLLAAPDWRGVLGAALALVMLAIAAFDARHFVIPNELNAAALALGLINVAVTEPEAWVAALGVTLIRGTIAAAVLLGIQAGYRWLRGREGLGSGDIKLVFVGGVWLGWTALPIAVEIAALVAIAFYFMRQSILRRPVRLVSRLPFGLFLAPAIWLCWLLEARLVAPFTD